MTKDEGGTSSAIDQVISSMPEDFFDKTIFVAHRAEVKVMLLTEYNEAEAMKSSSVMETGNARTKIFRA